MIEKWVTLKLALSDQHIYSIEDNGIYRVAAKALKSGELRPIKGAANELVRACDWEWAEGYSYDLDEDGDLVRIRMCPYLRWGIERVLPSLTDDRVVDDFSRRPSTFWMLTLPSDWNVDAAVIANERDTFLYGTDSPPFKRGDGVFIWAGEPHHCLVGFAEVMADAKREKKQTEVEMRFLCHTLQRPVYLDELVYDDVLRTLPWISSKELSGDDVLDPEAAARLLKYVRDRNPVVAPIAAAWGEILRERLGRDVDVSWDALAKKDPVRSPPPAAGCELTPGQEYRVLSVHPPWAWSIIFAGKDIENRSWTTQYRGPILIHASSKKYGGAALDEARREIAAKSGLPLDQIPAEFPRSQILGIVDVVDCIPNSRSQWAYRGEEHWVLANPRRLPEPIEGVDGKLNLWKWTAGGQR